MIISKIDITRESLTKIQHRELELWHGTTVVNKIVNRLMKPHAIMVVLTTNDLNDDTSLETIYDWEV